MISGGGPPETRGFFNYSDFSSLDPTKLTCLLQPNPRSHKFGNGRWVKFPTLQRVIVP